jgi:type IV pilus assembly protein PilB
LGDLLIEKGLITEAQLNTVLERQKESGGKLGELIVTMHILDAHVLAQALGEFFGLVVVDLRRDNVDPEVISLVPEELAREQLAIPVRFEDDGLYVAVAEPSDEIRSLLAKTTGRPVHLMIAPMSDIVWALDTNYRAIGSVGKLVQAFEASEGARRKTSTSQDTDVTTDDAPVVQVVDRILTQAMRDRASDVHIEPSEDYVRVRFRIDGALKDW